MNPHAPFRALAPQASASAYSATRTYAKPRYPPDRPPHDSKSGPFRRRESMLLPAPPPAIHASASRRHRTPAPTAPTITSPAPDTSSTGTNPQIRQPAPPASASRTGTGQVPALGSEIRAVGTGCQQPSSGCDHGLMTQNPATPGPTGPTGPDTAGPIAQDEVAGLCSDLIRIDTSNRGDNSGPGERQAAEHVAALLAEVGIEPTILESDKGRASVVARIEGERPDPPRPAHPRPPRRRARARGGLAGGPVLRGDRGRLRLGPRRGGHEGHGRDDAGRRPAADA